MMQNEQVSTDLSLSSRTFQSKNNHSTAMRTLRDKDPKGKRKWAEKSSKKMENKWKCSTSLELYKNPWKISKVLTKSDVGGPGRLLLGVDVVENFMLPVLGGHAQREVKTGTGSPISVWDVDTMSMHKLILKRWASFKNFVLIGGWCRDFVRRRELIKGDEIGLLWDSFKHCFNFSVLKRIQ